MGKRTASMIPFPTVPSTAPCPELAGTFMSLTWDEETEKLPPKNIMNQVREYCESQAMKDFCEKAGLHGTSFEWNTNNNGGTRYVKRDSTVSTRFWTSYEKSMEKITHIPGSHKLFINFWETYKHDPNQKRMAVVFHGTPEERIPEILKHGLDPRYRRTQAFGKGEYFSKEPGLATTYCKGGHKLVVYLIFIPEEHEKYYSQKDRDIVVVNNTSHELPVGVLSFESVDREVVQHTQQLRIEQKELKFAAIAKEKELKKAKEEGADEATIEKLDDEVHEAWDMYFVTRLDENRNLMDHLSASQVNLHFDHH